MIILSDSCSEGCRFDSRDEQQEPISYINFFRIRWFWVRVSVRVRVRVRVRVGVRVKVRVGVRVRVRVRVTGRVSVTG